MGILKNMEKKMEKKRVSLKKLLISIFVFTICGMVQAYENDYCCPGWYEGICPFAGIDYKANYTSGKRDWRSQFPNRMYSFINGYVGIKFHDNFGVEFGLEQSNKKKMTQVFGVDGRFFGLPLPNFIYRRTVSFRTWHFDLNYYIALMHHFDFMASIGWGYTSPRTDQTAISPVTTLLQYELINMKLFKKGIFRARTGLIYHVNNFFGVRGMIGYDNTGVIGIKYADHDVFFRHRVPHHPLRESFSLNFGFFFNMP